MKQKLSNQPIFGYRQLSSFKIKFLLYAIALLLECASGQSTVAPLLLNLHDKCVNPRRCSSVNPKKYRSEGPVGIRFKKTLLVSRDMASGTFDSHMQEAASRRRHQLFMFTDDAPFQEDFQLQQLCPSLEEVESQLYRMQSEGSTALLEEALAGQRLEPFCAVTPGETLRILNGSDVGVMAPPGAAISCQFYKPKYSYIQGSSSAASKSVETAANGGIHVQNQGSGEQLVDLPRDNHYLNLALGVKPYYELPTNTLECLDQEQTIEGFLFKKAKTTSIDNFRLLMSALEGSGLELGDHKQLTLDAFQSYAFTFEEPDFIANLTNGMRPNAIQKLKPRSSTLRFFTQDLDISPNMLISFHECQLLVPKFETLLITNRQRKKDILIRAMVASSPELALYLAGAAYENQAIHLRPQESLEVRVAFTSETLGLFEALLYVVVEEWVYVASFNAFVVPNAYDVQPFYMTDVLVNMSVELPLFLSNPSTTDTLIIEELYSTQEDVVLRWPHSREEMGEGKLTEGSLENGANSVVQYILIPEGGRKQVATMVFESNRTLDYVVEIHVRTSLHDILRVPLYFHVHQDWARVTPLDFGNCPLHFDILKIPIYAKSKLTEPLAIADILLPLADPRIDFQLVDLARSNTLKKGKETFLGYVLLNPSREGAVETKLTLVAAGQRSNRSYTMEVPIVGRVHKRAGDLLGPGVMFDLSRALSGEEGRRKLTEPPTFKDDVQLLSQPLMLKNYFNVPILVKGIVNQNPELAIVSAKSTTNQQAKPVLLKPGQSVEYGRLELNPRQLKVSQGTKYLSVLVNNTLVPLKVALFDRALLCSWWEDSADHHHVPGLEYAPLCGGGPSLYELNFDYVALNEVKQRRLKITNLNVVSVTIETIAKQQLDDLSVYIEGVVDKNGHTSSDFSDPSTQPLIGPKRTKRVINFQIQPQQTLCLAFQVLAKEAKQKFSRIDFAIKDGDSSSFSINYKYHAINGQLTFVPQVIQFGPTYPGMPISRALTARSTFEVPITVKSIRSHDIRILPTLHQIAIKPNNRTDFGSLIFDPSHHQQYGNTQGVLKGSPFADLQGFFNQPFINIDPLIQQNILQILNEKYQGSLGQVGSAQVQMIQIPKGGGTVGAQMQTFMTPQDVENFREKQKLWEDGSRTSGDITTSINIETNIYPNLTLQIKAHLRKPQLTEPQPPLLNATVFETTMPYLELIDFETVQIGQTASRSVRIVNPTDEPLVVGLFITTNDVYQRLMNLSKKDQNKAERVPQTQDPDFYFHTFCTSKRKGAASQSQVEPDINIVLSPKEDQVALCRKVSHVMTRILNSTAEEVDVLRRRIENFYKDSYLAEIKKSFAESQSATAIMQSKLAQPRVGRSQFEQTLQSQVQQQQFSVQFQQGQPFQYNGGIWMPFEPEVENITNLINQHSHARPVDIQSLNQLKANYERQREIIEQQLQASSSKASWLSSLIPDLWSIYDGAHAILKAIIHNRHPIQRPSPNATLPKHEKPKRELKYREPRGSLFRLNNTIMNEILINNDTSKLYQNQIILSDPMIMTYTGQSFFINPLCQGQVFKVEPRGNLTIKDAVIYQPQSLAQNADMKLILKNNLTLLHSVDLKGSPGTGLLEVQRVLKRAITISQQLSQEDRYVSAHTLSGYPYGPHLYQQSGDQQPEYTNLQQSSEQNKALIRERILGNIFGHREREGTNPGHREVLIRTNYRYGLSHVSQYIEQDPCVIPFHITQDDIFIPVNAQLNDREDANYQLLHQDFDFIEDHDSMLINRILQTADHKQNIQEVYNKYQQRQIKVQSNHKRVLLIQNTGNLPVSVDKIYFEDGRACMSQRFTVENCQPFSLNPGDMHWLHISYQNQFKFAKQKKKLILETKQGTTQEFTLEVQFPVDYLQAANDMLPLSKFEEWQQIVLKMVILSVAVSGLTLVGKDVFHHLRFTKQLIPECEERLAYFEDLGQQLNLKSQVYPVSYIFKQGGLLQSSGGIVDKRELIAPVLRDCVTNDQVFHLYQQAQDKLMDRSSVGRGQQTSQQLLLKEVANICSNKKSSVCLELQKQAIDTEKESRRLQSQRNMGYALELQMEREQARLQREREAAVAKEIALQQEAQENQRRLIEAKAKAAQEAAAQKKPQPMNAQKEGIIEQSKDSSVVISESSETIQREEDEEKKQTKTSKIIAPKLNKKQAARLQKQKLAEENFRKLEEERRLKKERDDELEAKRKQMLDEKAKKREEMEALLAKQREEREQELRQKQELAAKQAAQQAIIKSSTTVAGTVQYRKIELQSATPSDTQSVILENEAQSPLNISAFNPQTTTSQNVNQHQNKGKFNFEQKSEDKQYQISGLSQIDKKDQSNQLINEGEGGEMGEDSGFLDHLEHLKNSKDRTSMRSQNRPLIDKIFTSTDQPHSSENQQTFSQYVVREDERDESEESKRVTGGQSQQEASKEREQSEKSKDKSRGSQEQIVSFQFQPVTPNQSENKKLTKDDLMPFFESQRAVDTKKEERQRSESQKKAVTNPSPAGSYLSSSIFSYNPLTIFQNNNSQSQELEQPKTVAKNNRSSNLMASKTVDNNIDEEDQLPTDFGQFNQKFADEGVESENQEVEDEGQSSSNLYNVFQSASSIFSKPLFQSTTLKQKMVCPAQTKQSMGYYMVPSNVSSYFNQTTANKDAYQAETKADAKSVEFSIFTETPQLNNQQTTVLEEQKIGATISTPREGADSARQSNLEINYNETSKFKASQPFQPAQGSGMFDNQWGGGASGYSTQGYGLYSSGREDYGYQSNAMQYQGDYSQSYYQSEAYRRNQHSLYGHSQQQQTQYYPYNSGGQSYQYQTPPPPGLGFRQVTQGQSLYAQYSAGNPGYQQNHSVVPPPGFSYMYKQPPRFGQPATTFETTAPSYHPIRHQQIVYQGSGQPIHLSEGGAQGSGRLGTNGILNEGESSALFGNGTSVFNPSHNRSDSGSFGNMDQQQLQQQQTYRLAPQFLGLRPSTLVGSQFQQNFGQQLNGSILLKQGHKKTSSFVKPEEEENDEEDEEVDPPIEGFGKSQSFSSPDKGEDQRQK